MKEKTLSNSDVNQAKKNVPDLLIFGDGDMFKLLCKASSQEQGWMKSTRAMEIVGVGCLVQVTTQQRNPDGSYAVAEALTLVPEVKILWGKDIPGDDTITRRWLAPVTNHDRLHGCGYEEVRNYSTKNPDAPDMSFLKKDPDTKHDMGAGLLKKSSNHDHPANHSMPADIAKKDCENCEQIYTAFCRACQLYPPSQKDPEDVIETAKKVAVGAKQIIDSGGLCSNCGTDHAPGSLCFFEEENVDATPRSSPEGPLGKFKVE